MSAGGTHLAETFAALFGDLSALGVRVGELSPPWTDFFTNVLAPIRGMGLDPYLSELRSTEERIAVCLQQLESNPELKHDFVEFIQKQRNKEDKISADEAIRLAGINQALNYIIADRVAAYYPAREFARDPVSNRRMIPADRLLKYSNQARATIGEDGRYRDIAFAAGLLFDILYYRASTHPNLALRKVIQSRIEKTFLPSIKLGKGVIECGRGLKSLELERFSPVLFMLYEIGSIALLSQFPDYATVNSFCEKEKIYFRLRHQLERQKYFYSSAEAASLIASQLKVFREIADSIRFFDSPFILHAEGKKHEHDMMCLMHGVYSISKMKDPPKPGTSFNSSRSELAEFSLTLSADMIKVIRGG